jgi:hypothetical protein
VSGILTYIGGLVLAGLVGWGISELLSLPGRAARERKQAEDEQKQEQARAELKSLHEQVEKIPAIIEKAVTETREAILAVLEKLGAKITPAALDEINKAAEASAASATSAIMGAGHVGMMRVGNVPWPLRPGGRPGGGPPGM